jgi:hypothetical protein
MKKPNNICTPGPRCPSRLELGRSSDLACARSVIGFGSVKGAQRINPMVLVDYDTFNTWFDGDLLRVFDTMTDRDSNISV